MPGRFRWRPMEAADIDGVVSVAATAFPDHFEGRTCFAERFALFPKGCFALAAADDVKGYLIAYPWTFGEIPPLNTLLGNLRKGTDSLYLHDLALHPDMRGQGFARPIVDQLAASARALGFRRIALVSVNDSVPFWQGMGFEPVSGDPAVTRKLESYGPHSAYMIRKL